MLDDDVARLLQKKLVYKIPDEKILQQAKKEGNIRK